MMKKYIALFTFLVGITFQIQAQNTIDPTNCREGETVEYCRQHIKHAELMKDPEFAKKFEKDQAEILEIEKQMLAKEKDEIPSKAALKRVPVVFHVLHNDGTENISNAQIMDALYILNRDFSLQNADANNVYAPFQGMPVDVQIEFVLATKAPNGACFSGITRTKNALSLDGSDGGDQVSAIVAGNDVYNGQWPGNKYLNIFICGDIGGAAGYTYLPGALGTSMNNGIWVLDTYVGSIGTGSVGRSRTLTHELGHWLNVNHCWGGTNNPGLLSNCNTDDNITDTPNTIGVTSCYYFENTCGPVANVENYMDYSYCSKMFTAGQKARMLAALNSSTGGRSTVVSASNLAAVGADSNLVICAADFTSDKIDVCQGDDVQFLDMSYHDIQAWNWSFPGGTPSTSNLKDPIVTYNTPGVYAVTLIATDGSSNTMTEPKTSYIHVLPGGALLPYSEGFETYSSLVAANSFWRTKSNIGNQFEVFTGAGSEGNKCIRLRNFGQQVNEVDQLISNGFDLSGISPSSVVTFSFKYAYRKRNTANYEILRMRVSTDCGNTWSTRRTIAGPSLSNTVATTEWTPTVNDWVQVHVTGVNSTYFTENMQAMFEFESDGGNNLYLDQINFYNGPAGTASLSDLEGAQNVNLFPNPTEKDLNLSFSVANSSEVTVVIQDLTGKILRTELINATEGNNLVIMNTDNLAAGLYFINLKSGNSAQTLQFVVQ